MDLGLIRCLTEWEACIEVLPLSGATRVVGDSWATGDDKDGTTSSVPSMGKGNMGVVSICDKKESCFPGTNKKMK